MRRSGINSAILLGKTAIDAAVECVTLPMVAAILLLLATAAAGSAEEPVLIVDPAVGAAATETLGFAAQELSRYLKAITGKDYPVAHVTDRGTPATARLVVDSGFQEDEYCIRLVGSAVELTGGSPRGCLYGVYRFLQELGCCWPLPGKANEVVPQRTEIRWSGPELRSRPAIQHRGLIWYSLPPYDDDLLEIADYSAKNGLNFVYIHVGASDAIPSDFLVKLDKEVRARDLGIEWGGHFLPGYLPRKEFDEHPEYFRMENGKRTASLNMCPSSPEAAEIIARNSLADWQRLQTLPRFEMLHMYLDDLMGGGWCSCPLCSELSGSDQALKIINAVAERLPLGKTALAYSSYHATLYPPKQISPHANVRILYAPRERCYRHAMGECPTNQRYLAWLKPQVAYFPNDPAVAEYYLDLVLFRQMPLPLYPVIGRDIKVYREAGIDRISALSFQRYSDWAYGMNYYVLGKALWRGEGSPEDIDEYCQAVYGPSAGAMKQYFDKLFELVGTAMETCGYEGFADMRYPPDEPFTATHVAQLAPLLAKENVDRIENLVMSAQSTAAEPYRSRIDQQITLWKVARLDTKAMANTMTAILRMREFKAGRLSEADRQETIALIKEATANMNEAGEILLASPKPLRGPLISHEGGPVTERTWGGYSTNLKAWLKELERPTAAKP